MVKIQIQPLEEEEEEGEGEEKEEERIQEKKEIGGQGEKTKKTMMMTADRISSVKNTFISVCLPVQKANPKRKPGK